MTLTIERPPVREPVDEGTRREFIAGGLTLAALLAGCGDDDGPSAPSTRTVTGRFGPVRIPTQPKRVVVTYDNYLAFALALDLPLVAAPGARGAARNPFPGYLPRERLDTIKRFSVFPEINYEAIAAARPDIILNAFTDEPYHKRLSAIAPSLTIKVPDDEDWVATFRGLAAAFDKTDVADRLLAERQATLRNFAREIAAGPYAGATFTCLAVSPDEGKSVVFGPKTGISPVLVALGLRPSPAVAALPKDTYTKPFSAERFRELDADLLVVSGEPVEGSSDTIDFKRQAPLRDQPTWKALRGKVVNFLNIRQGDPYAEKALLEQLRPQLT